MKRQFRSRLTIHLGLAALSSLLFHSSVQGDSITAAGYQDNGMSGLSEIGSMKSQSAVEVFDLDTKTGAKSKVQQFTQRGPASFKGMSRDSGGTLWAVQDNRLVTINETTGYVTDIAILQDGTENSLDFPEIAFADDDVLYGIAKSSSFITIQAGNLAVSPGFRLVTIDTETGLVSDTGLDIGGRYNSGNSVAHGLVYDATYGLIHLWNESQADLTAGKPETGSTINISSVPTRVEILDPVTPSVTSVPYIDDVAPPSALVDGLAAVSGQFASGFQAVTGSGVPGGIRVFKADYMVSTFAVQIVEDQMIGTYFTSVLESTLPVMGIGSSRAMEQTGDGEGFVVEVNGELITFTPGAPGLTDASFASDSAWFFPTFSVFTSIGGYSPDFSSLATDPTTGVIYALGNNSAGGRVKRLTAGAEMGALEFPDFTRGLFVIDRDGPATIELGELDVEFTSPYLLPDSIKQKEKSSSGSFSSELTDVEAIAFDNTGALFGITYQGFLVTIDLSTGEVQEIPDVYLSNQNSKQLEFNPGDGKLYILSFNNSFDPSMIELTSVNRDGSELASTELSPELPMYNYPNSLVTLGNNSFLFSINSSGLPFLSEKESALESFQSGSQLYQLDKNGNVSPNPVFVSSVFITAMTQGGGFAQPDVLIGPTSRKLTGNNRYNRNGKGQTISIRGRGKTLSGEFFAEVQNDGSAGATFQIAASGGKRGDQVTYFQGSRNVTGAMRRGLRTPLEPGEESSFRITFSRKGGGSYKERFQFRATAEGSTDTGLARTALSAPKPRSLKPRGL
jgi:hypothetical protein